MKQKKLYLILALAALIFIGCNKDESPTEPTAQNGGTGLSNASGQPIPKISSENFNGVMATISYEITLGPGLPSTSLGIAFAAFGNNSDAGNVVVNDNSVGKMAVEGGQIYMSPSPTNLSPLSNVNFDGSQHSWTVSGGNGIPSLSGAVESPKQFTLTSPAQNAEIQKAGGLQVKWSTSGNESGAHIMLVIAQVSDENKYVDIEDVANNGSYTIESGKLSSLSGNCLLEVVKYTYKGLSSGGKDYYIISEIVKSVKLTLK